MSVKLIRPNIELPAAETNPAVIALLDAVREAAIAGVVSALAITWCDGDEFFFDSVHDGEGIALAGATHALALQLTHEVAFGG